MIFRVAAATIERQHTMTILSILILSPKIASKMPKHSTNQNIRDSRNEEQRPKDYFIA
jgi:hypothetical protein